MRQGITSSSSVEVIGSRFLPGGGVIDDHRTPEEARDTVGYVVATDRFMSGWGKAPSRSLFAVPLLTWDDAVKVTDHLQSLSQFMRVRTVGRNYRPHLRRGDHLSIRSPHSY